MNLLKNINKFYKHYDLEHQFDTITMTKADMHDHDALMTAYESIWLTMDQYDIEDKEYRWLSKLYCELGDYINGKSKDKSVIFKLIALMYGTFCIGIFTAFLIAYGINFVLCVGIILSIILAICSGISVYEDIKEA
jgi:hypothetical protein